jgi:general stress protein CsbA
MALILVTILQSIAKSFNEENEFHVRVDIGSLGVDGVIFTYRQLVKVD